MIKFLLNPPKILETSQNLLKKIQSKVLHLILSSLISANINNKKLLIQISY